MRRLLTALVVPAALALASPAAAQISPGPLARPHAGLEGALRCRECHGSGETDAMSRLCAGCHKEVAWLAQRRRGLHGAQRDKACASCHPDHAGREFQLVSWAEGKPERFDHARAGWKLEQSHRTLACDDCHADELRRSPAAALAPAGSTEPRWIGLETSCASCHTDVHRGALAENCLECHDQRKWTPAPRFAHDSTGYPLTGKHVQVACGECHASPRVAPRRTAAGDTIPVYRDLPHGQCSDCHADPHRGGLGRACGDCHLTTGFQEVTRQAFDHARTRYPLRGRHAAVRCEGCHDFATAAGRRPAFAACTSCHRDPHAGTATLAGKPADCGACHGLAGFTPATYTVARHAETRYPLEGRHRQVRCAGCHASRGGAGPAGGART
ncbi:MAG TPA: cytochrome c3 family protein, partial [Gemmatimonadales bacterium]